MEERAIKRVNGRTEKLVEIMNPHYKKKKKKDNPSGL